MFRMVLYVGGMAAGFAALLLWQQQKRAMRKVPVQEAAEMLKQAWADHHTRA